MIADNGKSTEYTYIWQQVNRMEQTVNFASAFHHALLDATMFDEGNHYNDNNINTYYIFAGIVCGVQKKIHLFQYEKSRVGRLWLTVDKLSSQ